MNAISSTSPKVNFMLELKRLGFGVSKEENVVKVYGGRRGKSAHRVLME